MERTQVADRCQNSLSYMSKYPIVLVKISYRLGCKPLKKFHHNLLRTYLVGYILS